MGGVGVGEQKQGWLDSGGEEWEASGGRVFEMRSRSAVGSWPVKGGETVGKDPEVVT